MALIPEDKLGEIRDRTDIVAVIGEYVSLKRAGASWKGLCPFHNEKSPSFNVHPVRQFFHCFGCGKSGDAISFIRELEGKSFLDAARDLARRAGIDLPEPPRSAEAQAQAQRAQSEREKLLRLNELAADFFGEQLAGPGGAAARAYLEKRGIAGTRRKEGAEEQLVTDVFRVGYAPAGWEALTRFLEEKRVPHELAERAGLVRQRDRLTDAQRPQPGAPPTKATHFDVFVDRVVYALTSPVGEVLGFGGRVMDPAPEGQPKYKNSPETLLYKKGENLFGLHAARHQIRRTGRALVVEGNFDVMTLHACGVGYAVAPQGTAITVEQVKLLSRFAREVVLMLDADPAGRAATLRVIHLFVEADLPCKIAALHPQAGPDGAPRKVDPDELARRDLPRLLELIERAPDAVEHYMTEIAAVAEASVPGRVRAISDCAPLLRAVPDRLARELYCDRLAQLLGVHPDKVKQAIRDVQARPAPRRAEEASAAVEPAAADEGVAPTLLERPLSRTVQKLVALLAQHPALLQRIAPDVVAAITDPDARALVEGGIARRVLDGQALETAAPAIRKSAAAALLSEEFAGLPQPEKALATIGAQLLIPRDAAGLEAARREAIARDDREMVELISARILARRRA